MIAFRVHPGNPGQFLPSRPFISSCLQRPFCHRPHSQGPGIRRLGGGYLWGHSSAPPQSALRGLHSTIPVELGSPNRALELLFRSLYSASRLTCLCAGTGLLRPFCHCHIANRAGLPSPCSIASLASSSCKVVSSCCLRHVGGISSAVIRVLLLAVPMS